MAFHRSVNTAASKADEQAIRLGKLVGRARYLSSYYEAFDKPVEVRAALREALSQCKKLEKTLRKGIANTRRGRK